MSTRLKNIAPKVAKNVTAKIVTLDIERLPGRHATWHRGQTVSGPFWDLNEIKGWTGRRIHPDDVQEWPRTICAAWRWYGEEEVHFASEWQVGGYDGFMRRAWEAFDSADIIVGHNMGRFDGPLLMSGWAEMGLPAPSPYKVIDTLKVARQVFGFESNTLDALNKRLGVDAKTDKYDVATARAAVSGDKDAQEKLASYNRGDIVASEALFDRLRPYARNLPHMGMWVDTGDEDGYTCPSCGHIVEATGKTMYANVQAYPAYQCPNCSAHVRGTKKLKSPTRTRSAS